MLAPSQIIGVPHANPYTILDVKSGLKVVEKQ